MPPLPADFIHARACKLKCEKILTRPLEQAAISKRAERLKEYKEHIEDLPEEDAERILKELAILEKIRAQD